MLVHVDYVDIQRVPSRPFFFAFGFSFSSFSGPLVNFHTRYIMET